MGAKKQIRDKRACDHCASQKLKCSFQHPCDQCHRKSLICRYSRVGYVDPYESFRVENENKNGSHQSDAQDEQLDPAAVVDLWLDADQDVFHEGGSHSFADRESGDITLQLSQETTATRLASGKESLCSLACPNIAPFSNENDPNDWLSMTLSPADFDIAANLTFPFAPFFDMSLTSLSWDLNQEADPPIPENYAPLTVGGKIIVLNLKTCLHTPGVLTPI